MEGKSAFVLGSNSFLFTPSLSPFPIPSPVHVLPKHLQVKAHYEGQSISLIVISFTALSFVRIGQIGRWLQIASFLAKTFLKLFISWEMHDRWPEQWQGTQNRAKFPTVLSDVSTLFCPLNADLFFFPELQFGSLKNNAFGIHLRDFMFLLETSMWNVTSAQHRISGWKNLMVTIAAYRTRCGVLRRQMG